LSFGSSQWGTDDERWVGEKDSLEVVTQLQLPFIQSLLQARHLALVHPCYMYGSVLIINPHTHLLVQLLFLICEHINRSFQR
jgi:hypothetical protein